MKDPTYVAGQVEQAVAADARTHELSVRAEVEDSTLVLHGEVASEDRRQLVGQVATEEMAAQEEPRLAIRNEVSVTEVRPPDPEPEHPGRAGQPQERTP